MAFRAMAYQRALEDAGVETMIARVHATAMEEFVVSDLVTREYLDARLAELSAEISRSRTEASAEIAKYRTEIARSRVETNTELAKLRADMVAEFAKVRAEFRTDIAAFEVRIIRWMAGMISGAALAVFLALLRFGR